MPKSSKRGKVKYKKPPGAPKRFKSSYMFFSTEKHIEIREQLEREGKKEKTTDIAKMVSQAWKNLTPEERNVWEVKANQDKVRYEVEKSMYTGPWKVPTKRRAKDKDAPKRPMSAFLAYSHERRAQVKEANPDMDNIDVSRELAKMWKVAPQEEKQKYIDEEAEKREEYKVKIADWRAKNEEKETAIRQERFQRSMSALEAVESSYASHPSAGDPSLNHPLVAAASSAVAASRLARSSAYPYVGGGVTDPYGADYYGSTSYPSSLYGQGSYSNSPWMSSASASSTAYAASRQQEEQAAAAAAYAQQHQLNPYGATTTQPMSSTLMGALNGSTLGSYGAVSSSLDSQRAYAAPSPYATNLSNIPAAYSYGGRGLTEAEEQQQQALIQQQDWTAAASYPSSQLQQQQQRGGATYPPPQQGGAGPGGGSYPPSSTGYM